MLNAHTFVAYSSVLTSEETNLMINKGIKGLSGRMLYLQVAPQERLLLITGWSVGDHLTDIYHDLLERMDQYFHVFGELNVFLHFKLVNCVTVKFLFKLIKLFNLRSEEGCQVRVRWIYTEGFEEMLDTGLDFAELASFDFKVEMGDTQPCEKLLDCEYWYA